MNRLIDREPTLVQQKGALPPKIFWFDWKQKGEVTLINQVFLGRGSYGSTEQETRIVLKAPIVSREHGLFENDGDADWYTNLSRSNGTIYQGRVLKPLEKVKLSDGEILRIRGINAKEDEQDVVLVYSTSYHPNYEWHVQHLTDQVGQVLVGRNEEVTIKDIQVSRTHASFFHAAEGWAVADLGSTNGVLVNRKKIDSPVYLKPMDVIDISGYLFIFVRDRLIYQSARFSFYEPNNQPTGDILSVWIEERNVWQRLKKKTLLKDIRLEIPSGKLVLILGGSGAGKTTFMNAVMGYEKAEGHISYNDLDIYKDYEQMKYEIGYVPQQSVLRPNDTVYDTLLNAAKMRLPKHYSEQVYEQAVEETLDKLALSDIKYSMVRQISGGQNRRLNIAAQYIGDPKLFFLDEPDSGLDSSNARELMKNLRQIADDGKIVLIISHSPDRAFELFDLVIVLAKGSDGSGHLVYFGKPKDACSFFEVRNLESIVKRINSPQEGGDGMADEYIEKFQRGR